MISDLALVQPAFAGMKGETCFTAKSKAAGLK